MLLLSVNLTSLRDAMLVLDIWRSLDIMQLLFLGLFLLGLSCIVLIFHVARLSLHVCYSFLSWWHPASVHIFHCWSPCFTGKAGKIFFRMHKGLPVACVPLSSIGNCWAAKDGPRWDKHLSSCNDRPKVHERMYICLHRLSLVLFLSRVCLATNPGQSGPGSNGNEGVLHIPQTIIKCSLMLYPGYE